MHDWMFDQPEHARRGGAQDAARKLGLDGTKFDECLTTSKHAAAVQ